MKFEVHRQACCSQDDQLGPLDQTFELPDQASVGELVDAVAGSRFLQFSSTHTMLICRVAGRDIATVFSPYLGLRRAPVFAVAPDTPVRSLASDNAIEFVFAQDR